MTPLFDLRAIFVNCHITFSKKKTLPLNHIWATHFHAIPELCQQYILQFQRYEDRLDRLVGRLLLRDALIEQGFSDDCLERIILDENSRPYINKNIDFNISHSGDIVICALSENCRIGIDIERITPVNSADYHQFFSSHQLHEIAAAKDPNHNFFDSWTIRESLLKADGRGLTLPLQNFNPQLNRCTIDNCNYYYQKLDIAPKYSCHISSSKQIDNLTLSEKQLS